MKRIVGYCVMLVTAAFLFNSLAPDADARKRRRKRKKPQRYEAPWGMAGCGLWSSVIKDKGQGAQLGVWALRNFVLNSQTSAITSGTSNCVHQRNRMAAKEQEVYLTTNLASLSKEAAQGEGEHLWALSEVFGCPYQEFARMSQDRYDVIFQKLDPEKVLDNYLDEVNSHKTLDRACRRTG